MRDPTGDDIAHAELRDRVRAALAERHAVGEEIGSGASAVVFAARDLLHFERDVAETARNAVDGWIRCDATCNHRSVLFAVERKVRFKAFLAWIGQDRRIRARR